MAIGDKAAGKDGKGSDAGKGGIGDKAWPNRPGNKGK
jgi:hypothetical protein